MEYNRLSAYQKGVVFHANPILSIDTVNIGSVLITVIDGIHIYNIVLYNSQQNNDFVQLFDRLLPVAYLSDSDKLVIPIIRKSRTVAAYTPTIMKRRANMSEFIEFETPVGGVLVTKEAPDFAAQAVMPDGNLCTLTIWPKQYCC